MYFCALLTDETALRLTERDLPILASIMKNAVSKWREVGLCLGFKNYELTAIEKQFLSAEGDTHYFREMLSQWLRCIPSIHSCPTLETLVAVLRNAGEEKTAKILQEKYQLKSSKCISYFVSEVKAENWQSIYSLVATANLQYCIYS